ncbi:MAG: DUF5011 domain-containing protein [Bacteroidota bacterium]|nr:MAG: DUF5011 domain-containing protein [Bacteroidota bacterium]
MKRQERHRTIQSALVIGSSLLHKAWLFLLLVFIIVACEPWNETADVSHVSEFPEFELEGEGFESFVTEDSAEYTDKGARAFANDMELLVYSQGRVDLSIPGVYTIQYFAQNEDGIWGTAERIVAVTYQDVTANDLSGHYTSSGFGQEAEMKLVKTHPQGLYTCNDIMGYPDAEMKGKLVDLGNHTLVLVHGEGDFGSWADREGEYTLSSLAWTLALLDEPYQGVEVDIVWQKKLD